MVLTFTKIGKGTGGISFGEISFDEFVICKLENAYCPGWVAKLVGVSYPT